MPKSRWSSSSAVLREARAPKRSGARKVADRGRFAACDQGSTLRVQVITDSTAAIPADLRAAHHIVSGR